MTTLRPFFRHPGSKYLLTKRLQPPRHTRIVEPFAGSACYSVTHGAGRNVVLCDADPDIAEIWRWLIGAPAREVMSIPVDFGDADIRTLGLDRPAMLFVQRWLAPQGGGTQWRMPPSSIAQSKLHPGAVWSGRVRQRIAAQLEAIRSWRVLECDYGQIDAGPSTWIIDPPYEHNGHARAKYGADVTDYAALGRWCMTRPGQVIVHEQHGATWLPFRTLNAAARTAKTAGSVMKTAHEVYWTNDATDGPDPLFSWAGLAPSDVRYHEHAA